MRTWLWQVRGMPAAVASCATAGAVQGCASLMARKRGESDELFFGVLCCCAALCPNTDREIGLDGGAALMQGTLMSLRLW